jgi:hypothetical protein
MPEGETLYPFEVVVPGTPLSLQAKSAKHREAWKKQVTEAARKRQYTERRMCGLIALRNQIVHGDVAAEPAAGDVNLVLAATEETLAANAP